MIIVWSWSKLLYAGILALPHALVVRSKYSRWPASPSASPAVPHVPSRLPLPRWRSAWGARRVRAPWRLGTGDRVAHLRSSTGRRKSQAVRATRLDGSECLLTLDCTFILRAPLSTTTLLAEWRNDRVVVKNLIVQHGFPQNRNRSFRRLIWSACVPQRFWRYTTY